MTFNTLKEDRRAVSNQVATLVLIAAAVVGGAFLYMAFRGRGQSATRNADLRPVELTGIEAGGNLYLSATLKNTGTTVLENVKVEVPTKSIQQSQWTVGASPTWRDAESSSENVTTGNDMELGGVPVPSNYVKVDNIYDLQSYQGTYTYDNLLLTQDIDASATRHWNGGDGWGAFSYFFTTFDGNGYAIKNLYITGGPNTTLGIPAFIDTLYGGSAFSNLGHTVKNLGFENITVDDKADWYGGALASSFYCATIENVYSLNGTIETGMQAGGLVGRAIYGSPKGEIINSYTKGGSIWGDAQAGGLVGQMRGDQTIEDSYSAVDNVYDNGGGSGGLVGHAYINISANDQTASSNTIRRSYAAVENVRGVGENAGLLTKSESGSATVENSFWDNELCTADTSDAGAAKTTAEMQTQSTYTDAGWDFTDVWEMGSYPQLQPYSSVSYGTLDNGTWTSVWKDLGSENASIDDLSVASTIPGASSAEIRVLTSDDGSSAKSQTSWLSLGGGTEHPDLSGLQDGRYARLKFRLHSGSSPTLDNYVLSYSDTIVMMVETVKPMETVSMSKQVVLDAGGVKLAVKVSGKGPDGTVAFERFFQIMVKS